MTTLPKNAFIQVRIKEETPQGEFNDALYFTPEQWDKLEEKDLDSKIQERVDNWVYVVTHPAPPLEYTKEELEAQKLELENYMAQIEAQIVDVQNKITLKNK